MAMLDSFFNKNKKKATVRSIPPRRPVSAPVGEDNAVEGEGPSVPAGLWEKCASCQQIVYADDLQANLKVCPNCGHHFRLTARQRLLMTADDGSIEEFAQNLRSQDPLDFPGYREKLKNARSYTGLQDAAITARAKVQGEDCVLCAMDGNFFMGSMGAAVGEKLTIAVEKALEWRLPLIIFTVSGGARMQEGIVSLMQMAKVSAALGRFADAGLLYVAVLTDPTTGGVTASFAMLGDITLAEPNALIGFAGRRVIEQTTHQSLPPHFQRAEFLEERGFVDRIVERKDMTDTLGRILRMHGWQAGRPHGSEEVQA